jgi:hypothetical protein
VNIESPAALRLASLPPPPFGNAAISSSTCTNQAAVHANPPQYIVG